MNPPDEAAKEAARRQEQILARTLVSEAHPTRTHEDYQIGVICALATEKAAMVAMLDETHPKSKKENGDDNEYTQGRIGVHNVVIACLPAGLMGNGPAAIVANNMRRSFPIKFGLMVGIGGGVWSKKSDIRLGDVVVSQPTGTHGGVVQWDFGKMEKDGKFQRTGSLDKPPPVLLHALQELKTFDITDGVNLEESLSLMVQNKPRMGQTYRYQGADHDQLFEATYDHEGDKTCDDCDPKLIVQRPAREDSAPRIHYGNIASGNEVMKHGTTRDKIAKEEGVICFEMEAAGLMDNFRCLVIRGICDYADSHKNKIWQPYAAATAAAFARALLGFIDEQEVIKTPHLDESVSERIIKWLSPQIFKSKQSEVFSTHQPGTGNWFLELETFQQWVQSEGVKTLWCQGIPGAGKTVITSIVIDYLLTHQQRKGDAIAYIYCDYKKSADQKAENLILSLLGQLITQCSPVPHEIQELYETYSREGRFLSIYDSISILIDLSRQFRRTFVIVDALDEYCQPSIEARGVPYDLATELERIQSHVHLFITSRHKQNGAFEGALQVEILASVSDIREYLGSTFRENTPSALPKGDETLKEEVISKISENCGNIFLLANLQARYIINCQTTTRKNVRQALDNMPRTLRDTYDDAIRRIKDQGGHRTELAMRSLVWISCAKRTLSVEELRHALTIEPEDYFLDESGMPDSVTIVKVCSGLVITEYEDTAVGLVHSTLQEYLKESRETLFPHIQEYISRALLTYLSFDIFVGLCSNRGSLESLRKQYILLDYASHNWGDHAKGEPESAISQLILAYLRNESKTSFWAQNCHMPKPKRPDNYERNFIVSWQFEYPHGTCKISDEQLERMVLPFNRDTLDHPIFIKIPESGIYDSPKLEPIHIAAHWGLNHIISLLLESGDDVDSVSSDGRTALHEAASSGHGDLIEILVSKGADINARTSLGKTALHLAARNGHRNVVQTLIKHKSLIVADKYLETALHDTARAGCTEIAQLLLDFGAAVEAQNSLQQTPLHFAAQHGHQTMVKFLLDKGSEIHLEDHRGHTPLSLAAEKGHDSVMEMILDWDKEAKREIHQGDIDKLFLIAAGRNYQRMAQFLLSRDANVGFWTEYEGTALHLAASHNSLGLAGLLLSHGADKQASGKDTESPLHLAAARGQMEMVKFLLDSGADIEASDKSGLTPLVWTAQNGEEECTQFLLDRGAKIDAFGENGGSPLHGAAMRGHLCVVDLLLVYGVDKNCKDSSGCTALHHAVAHRRDEVALRLLELGTDPGIQNRKGQTALHIAANEQGLVTVLVEKMTEGDVSLQDELGKTALVIAASEGHLEIARIILQKMRKPDIDLRDAKGWTALAIASCHGHLTIVQLLLEYGADMMVKTFFGKSPLHWASVNGFNPIVRLLLENGADVNAKDVSGRSALHWAAENHREGAVKILIDGGAKVTLVDSFGRTPAHWAAASGSRALDALLGYGADMRDKIGRTPLHLAAAKGKNHSANLLLVSGADLSTKDMFGNTALHLGAGSGEKATVELIIQKRANANEKNENGEVPLHLATRNLENGLEIAQLLCNSGADIKAKDSLQQTALHWAAEKGSETMVRWLLENGVESSARSERGETAQQVAARCGFEVIVRLLLYEAPYF